MNTGKLLTAEAPVAAREEAEQRLALICNALEFADDLLDKAFTHGDWRALGHSSWEEYCEARLKPMRMLRLSKITQTEKFAAHAQAGMSTHAIAALYGVSQGTVRNRIKGVEKPETVTGRDGIRRPSQQPVKAPAPLSAEERYAAAAEVATYVLAARAIAACGSSGGTTLEVIDRTSWRQGPASVALSRAAKKGLVVPTGERRHAVGASPGFTVYVAR